MFRFKMNFMKCLFIFIFCLTQIFTINAFAMDVDNLKDIANSELKKFSKTLKWSNYNISSKEEFQNMTVGQGLPVYRFDMEKLSQGVTNLHDAMYDTNIIEYTVISNGKDFACFDLIKEKGSYSGISLGGKGYTLANGFKQLTADDLKAAKIVKFGPATFLYTEDNNNEKLIYTDEVPIEGIESYKTYKSEDIIPVLKKWSKSMITTTASSGLGTKQDNRASLYKTVLPIVLAIVLLSVITLFIFYYKKDIHRLK